MRPSRVIFYTTASFLFLLVFYTLPGRSTPDESPSIAESTPKGGFSSLFSFHTPLFPPSAIISLTDDNSTFFLARPAAFGPDLPARSLSGQIWIGSGFSEDILGRGGLTAGAEGELGCTDVPGWEDRRGNGARPLVGGLSGKKQTNHNAGPLGEVDANHQNLRRRHTKLKASVKSVPDDDGTDNHLQDGLGSKAPNKAGFTDTHADIQSLQESAEIQGKVVLLSRGGCGFLEKAKWAQRRGAIALIVGDDVVGGPLVTMYAKGDISNVTIPALFTSHTTAHLLSSLIPSGRFAFPKQGKGEQAVKGFGEKSGKGTASDALEAHKIAGSSQPDATKSKTSNQVPLRKGKKSWVASFFSLFGFGSHSNQDDSRRPISSGQLDWEKVGNCKDCVPGRATHKTESKSKTPGSIAGNDDFVIGQDDWRDTAARKGQVSGVASHPPRSDSSATDLQSSRSLVNGRNIPNSGEYQSSNDAVSDTDSSSTVNEEPKKGWLSNLGWSADGTEVQQSPGSKNVPSREPSGRGGKIATSGNDERPKVPHEGLWVTLTPTNMSSSPFFDTLLVLVVSPLVTLTVVYALLLLRSRIRRRRWRAPKSVVERLPVRTYQTIPSETSESTLATPAASSPTTPLLQSSSRRAISRQGSRTRLRSYTTSEVPESSSASSPTDLFTQTPTESEKRESGLAEWRRRYGGRQRECVVCLEEYVDGVSQVLTLPCGHEFHQECITPWLTTRRRTCPICKGDVVKSITAQGASSPSTSTFPSLFRASPPSPNSSIDNPLSRSGSRSPTFRSLIQRPLDDVTSDAVQSEVALTRNDSPSSALPISAETPDPDLERGRRSASPLDRSFRRSGAPSPSPDRFGGETGEGVGQWLQRNVSSGIATLGRWSGLNAAPRQRRDD